jgi:DNA-binding CsgD family transcriptional regulator/tetratricopeptide (TPR) repeat protein
MKQPFVGRTELLETLHDRYRKAQCGDGGGVILRGDAGIGKSRLIGRFLETAGANDPYIVATDLLFSGDAGNARPSAAERRRSFDGVAQLFRIAAADAPTTVVIDDLHYADPATLHLLYHIAAATRHSAFFLLAATRPLACDDNGTPSPLYRLQRLDQVITLTVGPLASEACEALILGASNGLIPKETRQHIHDRSEGNPLFAEELVRQALSTSREPARAVPATVAETVLERSASLSEHDRAALHLAAALGRRFEATLLARIIGREFDDLLLTLRRAVRLGLVEETEDPDVFRFRHALTQEAIYGELLAAERQQIHRRIFSELQSRPPVVDNVAALALHAYASGDRTNTAYYNELAGDHAAGNQAFESASEFYERALAVHGDDDAETTRVCQKLATAYLLAGFPERAGIPVRRALAQHRRRGEIESVADALLLLADIAGQGGDDELRLELLAEANQVLANATEPKLQARRALCAFEIAIANRDVDRILESSAELANSSSVDLQIAIALRNATAQALLMQRRYQAAVQAQANAVRLATQSGNVEQLAASRFAFGIVLSLSGKLARASEAFAESATIARARWATTEGAIGLAFQAEVELIRGHFARARELMEEAMPDARRSDHPMLITMMGRVGIFLGVRTDDATLIRQTVSALDLEALFRERTAEQFFPLSGAFAQFLDLEGRRDESRSVLERAVRRLSAKRLRSTDWSPCTMLTIAAIGPEPAIPEARRPIADWFAPYAPAFVSLFDAIVAERFGDREAATRHAAESIAAFHAFEFRFEEAIALSMTGRKAEALALFEQFGAYGFAERTREEMTPKNRRGRPVKSLTSRERDVASLVAEGLTNREISDRLFVTEKTVETHLASIFSKLEVRSRTDVASRLGPVERATP